MRLVSISSYNSISLMHIINQCWWLTAVKLWPKMSIFTMEVLNGFFPFAIWH